MINSSKVIPKDRSGIIKVGWGKVLEVVVQMTLERGYACVTCEDFT